MNGEKGQALPLAILVLAIGTLVISPFLGHASASLIGSGVYEQRIEGIYACDAGIEYAIWSLQSGTLEVAEGSSGTLPGFTLNGMTVNTVVDNPGGNQYLITATGTGSFSATTEVVISGGGGDYTAGDIVLGWREIRNGDVLADGDIILGSESRIVGNAYATGSINMNWISQITGDTVAGDDIHVGTQAIIGGDAHADGAIQLEWRGKITGNACSGGNIILASEAEIGGDVSTTGNLEMGWDSDARGYVFFNDDTGTLRLMGQADIHDDVYIFGDINNIQLDYQAIIRGGVYITGHILGSLQLGWQASIWEGIHENYTGTHPPLPACPSLPSDSSTMTILSWQHE